jgi:hypothetical protein
MANIAYCSFKETPNEIHMYMYMYILMRQLTIFTKTIFRIILILRHANSWKVAQSGVKSRKVRTSWAVMASPVKSIFFRTF